MKARKLTERKYRIIKETFKKRVSYRIEIQIRPDKWFPLTTRTNFEEALGVLKEYKYKEDPKEEVVYEE